jgi:hypothetical protein
MASLIPVGIYRRGRGSPGGVSFIRLTSIRQAVGLKGNRLQKHLVGSYFAAFSTDRITIDLRNPQNLPPAQSIFGCIYFSRFKLIVYAYPLH